jgi:hypothetical protein
MMNPFLARDNPIEILDLDSESGFGQIVFNKIG